MIARILMSGLLLAALCFEIGCGDSDPKRFRISGIATVDGKPIPFGDIVFTPDGSKNNSGPQGIANIVDGKFDTGVDGKGIAGGPTIIRVSGFAEQGGKQLLCEHELKMDLPRTDSTQNLDVPAKAGSKAPRRPDI